MIAMKESAQQIRARYYRERAAAIRARTPSIAFADLRSELCHLATEYEWLAEYLAPNDHAEVPGEFRPTAAYRVKHS
jgi:hypothetical protein